MVKSYVFAMTYALVCFFYNANGQTNIAPRENTISHNQISSGNKHVYVPRSVKSAIKINVSSLLRADYCISYEKRLNNWLSAEVTGGVTCYNKFMETMDFFNYRPQNMVAANRIYNVAPSLKLGARHYFGGAKEISGSYLNVEGMYRRYGYTVKKSYTAPSIKEYSDQKEIRLSFGCQSIEKNNSAFYDCSIGMGYRFHERKFLGYSDGNKFSSQGLVTGKKNYLVFVVNFKVGFGL